MSFYCCEKCGKKLIERKPNGMWVFKFGKTKDEYGEFTGKSPVYMEIYGSLQMRCIRRECNHMNVLNFFPFAAIAKEEES